MVDQKEINTGVFVDQEQQGPENFLPSNSVSEDMLSPGIKISFDQNTRDGSVNYAINSNFELWQRGNALKLFGSGIFYHSDRFAWAAGTITGTVNSEKIAVASFANSSILPKSCRFMQRYQVQTTQPVLNTLSTAGPWYKVEGYDFAKLLDSGALTRGLTVSFYTGGLSGTYAMEFFNSAADNRHFKTYSITTTNSWARKSIYLSGSDIVTGISSGTWDYSNGIGLGIRFWLAAGATSQGATQNAWTGSTPNVPAGSVNFLSAVNQWGITGLMINVGNVVPDFSTRCSSYPEELLLSRRYYEKTYSPSIDPGSLTFADVMVGITPIPFGSTASPVRVSNASIPWEGFKVSSNIHGNNSTIGLDGAGRINDGTFQLTLDPNGGLSVALSNSSSIVIMQLRYKVSKRAAANITIYNPNDGSTGFVYNSITGNLAAVVTHNGLDAVDINNTTVTRSGDLVYAHLTADAEL